MSSSTSARLRALAGAGLVLAGALTLTACGEVRAPGSTAAATPSASASARGASPYVEPGAGDGAPHYNENNAYRQSGDMSPAHAKDAEREAERIRPVLKQLWEQRKWEPSEVRSALLRLGYEEERITKDGKRLGGTLTVRDMFSRYKNDGYVTPEGSLVALRVHDDACVSAFVQKSNYGVETNGPYPETGCFEPPYGH
ncbi:hypothetical protein EAO75_09875 [Streptomyces sp. uw30]|uniref:hypothetical protein n=1 Tax=Streptomyces sp. uw30 TaxID=1828179 RepID=UPI0011CE24B9|nr:hypothetical protein [Streptomyces sp. uw30]TXS51755.1 hypothetical protein EAO75_09875 [Streptomyces sp. uw30]